MQPNSSFFWPRLCFACAALVAVFAPKAIALTWEGKSLTLTLPDDVTPFTSFLAEGTRGDSYGCSWKTPERRNNFELHVFGKFGETAKEELKALTEQHLANIKAEIAQFKYKRTCTNVMPLRFTSGGWAGYGFKAIDVDDTSKSMKAFMLLWGGDRAWQVSFSGTQNQYPTLIRFLESTVWKLTAAAQAQRGLSQMILPPQEKREWTNASGKTFEGKLIAINDVGNILRIERSDGQIFEGIPVNFLSAKDREYIKKTILEMEKSDKTNPKPPQ
jgi:hypothetical protein